MVVAHAALTHAAKGQVMLCRVQDAVVHRDTAGHDVGDQVFYLRFVVAERVERQWPRACVDGIYRLIQGFVANDGQHGAKDFTRAQRTVGGRVQHDMWRNFACGGVPGQAGNERYQGGTHGLGLLQGAHNALEGPVINDRGVVLTGQAAVAPLHDLFGRGNKLLELGLRQVQVIHGGADLACVKTLGKQQAFSGSL